MDSRRSYKTEPKDFHSTCLTIMVLRITAMTSQARKIQFCSITRRLLPLETTLYSSVATMCCSGSNLLKSQYLRHHRLRRVIPRVRSRLLVKPRFQRLRNHHRVPHQYMCHSLLVSFHHPPSSCVMTSLCRHCSHESTDIHSHFPCLCGTNTNGRRKTHNNCEDIGDCL